ncbi:UNKNOWN [Stylonychia lemnae]|uniref:Uncharacterized protein n=1 Tax=Stylonychia lemnae TaxID=5949 RepID=A0A078A4D3_STYLE|nr:UNKNOWN [Stylonychia lemnae]|eukprot:CDW76348.1 UNKNOWN [Stylonychia lemnae]
MSKQKNTVQINCIIKQIYGQKTIPVQISYFDLKYNFTRAFYQKLDILRIFKFNPDSCLVSDIKDIKPQADSEVFMISENILKLMEINSLHSFEEELDKVIFVKIEIVSKLFNYIIQNKSCLPVKYPQDHQEKTGEWQIRDIVLQYQSLLSAMKEKFAIKYHESQLTLQYSITDSKEKQFIKYDDNSRELLRKAILDQKIQEIVIKVQDSPNLREQENQDDEVLINLQISEELEQGKERHISKDIGKIHLKTRKNFIEQLAEILGKNYLDISQIILYSTRDNRLGYLNKIEEEQYLANLIKYRSLIVYVEKQLGQESFIIYATQKLQQIEENQTKLEKQSNNIESKIDSLINLFKDQQTLQQENLQSILEENQKMREQIEILGKKQTEILDINRNYQYQYNIETQFQQMGTEEYDSQGVNESQENQANGFSEDEVHQNIYDNQELNPDQNDDEDIIYEDDEQDDQAETSLISVYKERLSLINREIKTYKFPKYNFTIQKQILISDDQSLMIVRLKNIGKQSLPKSFGVLDQKLASINYQKIDLQKEGEFYFMFDEIQQAYECGVKHSIAFELISEIDNLRIHHRILIDIQISNRDDVFEIIKIN